MYGMPAYIESFGHTNNRYLHFSVQRLLGSLKGRFFYSCPKVDARGLYFLIDHLAGLVLYSL